MLAMVSCHLELEPYEGLQLFVILHDPLVCDLFCAGSLLIGN